MSNSSKFFIQTLDAIGIEVKKQFLNGAQRIVLTRDGYAIFCEPDDYKSYPVQEVKENKYDV